MTNELYYEETFRYQVVGRTTVLRLMTSTYEVGEFNSLFFIKNEGDEPQLVCTSDTYLESLQRANPETQLTLLKVIGKRREFV